ncbi:MAG: hypothetical protein R6W86_06130 [Marinobacter sp.]|uniref:hypothetical protein n=1 Tax=Marinobacter sp. TaxID=50741 RepID=UPI00396DDADE
MKKFFIPGVENTYANPIKVSQVRCGLISAVNQPLMQPGNLAGQGIALPNLINNCHCHINLTIGETEQ